MRVSGLLPLVLVALLSAGGVLLLQGRLAPAVERGPGGVAPGLLAPAGALPPPTPTPRTVFFRREPYGPVKIDPGTVHRVELGPLDSSTVVRAVVTVAFNNRLSNLSGTPDVDVAVVGPSGTVASYPQARNGQQIGFQTSSRGEYAIVLDNGRSRVNAKQVGVQFLQP